MPPRIPTGHRDPGACQNFGTVFVQHGKHPGKRVRSESATWSGSSTSSSGEHCRQAVRIKGRPPSPESARATACRAGQGVRSRPLRPPPEHSVGMAFLKRRQGPEVRGGPWCGEISVAAQMAPSSPATVAMLRNLPLALGVHRVGHHLPRSLGGTGNKASGDSAATQDPKRVATRGRRHPSVDLPDHHPQGPPDATPHPNGVGNSCRQVWGLRVRGGNRRIAGEGAIAVGSGRHQGRGQPPPMRADRGPRASTGSSTRTPGARLMEAKPLHPFPLGQGLSAPTVAGAPAGGSYPAGYLLRC